MKGLYKMVLVKEPVEAIPLKMNRDNVILVGNTRVTLDIVVDAFVFGATPEEIIYQYPSLDLADVYAVVGYYLNHRTEVEVYLKRRLQQAQKVKQENEQRFSPIGVRQRLLNRQQEKVIY